MGIPITSGFAARLHRETGVAAYIHGADVDRARLKVKKPNSGWGPVKIGPLAGFLWYSARRGGLRLQPAAELQTVADGDVLDVPGSPRIIHTPGHTPGSVPFTLEPGQAVASLDRIAGVDATWLLPGHGPAWDSGVPEAVRLIREAAKR